jgi:hypothetical protein
MPTIATALGAIAVVVVAVSFADLSIGLLETLASDFFGAIRRLGKGSQQ